MMIRKIDLKIRNAVTRGRVGLDVFLKWSDEDQYISFTIINDSVESMYALKMMKKSYDKLLDKKINMKATGKYILNEKGNPIEETDLIKWATWFETSGGKRIVKKEKVGDMLVSTVFLGIDYRFGEKLNDPILYETMVFGGKHANETERYATREQASLGHEIMVEYVKEH